MMLLGILLLSLMSSALADNDAALKYKNCTTKQISKIRVEERSSDVLAEVPSEEVLVSSNSEPNTVGLRSPNPSG